MLVTLREGCLKKVRMWSNVLPWQQNRFLEGGGSGAIGALEVVVYRPLLSTSP